MQWGRGALVAALFAVGAGAIGAPPIPDAPSPPPAPDTGWLVHGGTNDEQRFSPLDQINDGNVDRLGLAWYQDIGLARGLEATPIVADGVLYLSTAWSMVRAFDARTGKPLWSFDPEVPRDTLVKACCDAVNRGVALSDGKVVVATLDGRLIALDAKSGRQLWSVVTVDQAQPYTITGAPRIAKGKVLIGNAGAELGVRGYVSAYDLADGKLAWRFYTVPGDPAKAPENAAMAKARETWKGDLWWKRGGGGTPWDAIVYDERLDLVFIGTGNGAPWNQAERSPGGGDNLYLSSIVALRPDTGEYVWHYQETPGETWDYTSTQPLMIADLAVGGRTRHVIMHAPKNGFFYILDAATGELLSARNFVPVNWASGIDMKSGRPIANPEARYEQTGKPAVVLPGSRGGHNWMPWSYSPRTGLVYFPAQETAEVFFAEPGFRMRRNAYNTADDLFGLSPQTNIPAPPSKGYLLAWNPVEQREVWRVPHADVGNGGTLATAGNLVVEGEARGMLGIYRATDGKRLWAMDVQGSAMSGAVSYAVGGQQYIAISVGCGGDYVGTCRLVDAQGRRPILDRLMVFKLGGQAQLPPRPAPQPIALDPPPATATAQQVKAGGHLFGLYCAICHGGEARSSGLNPDLRASPALHGDLFEQVVRGGLLKDAGMASFADALTRDEVSSIRAYVIARANEDKRAGK